MRRAAPASGGRRASVLPRKLVIGSSHRTKEPITVPRRNRTMQTNHSSDTMTVKITPNDCGNPASKLADAELHFGGESPLAGLKLMGFSIWERRGGSGRNVTFPARSYAVNGERRSFALPRPIADVHAQERIRDTVLAAYAEYEQEATAAAS